MPDSANVDAKEAAMILAASLYEKGELSLRQAAEVAELSKRTFTELPGNYGVSHPAKDITTDVKNA